jgi:hypothetical protein
MEDEAQAEPCPLAWWHQSAEIGLDTCRVVRAGEPQATGDTRHVGIDDERRDAEGDAEDDVGGLAPDAAEPHQVLHAGRHLTSVARDQILGHLHQGAGLGPEETRGTDDVLDLGERGGREVFDGGVAGEEHGGDPVHALVSGPGAEDGGDQQLEGRAMDEGRPRRILRLQALGDDECTGSGIQGCGRHVRPPLGCLRQAVTRRRRWANAPGLV